MGGNETPEHCRAHLMIPWERGQERTVSYRAPRSAIEWMILAVCAAGALSGLLLLIGHYP